MQDAASDIGRRQFLMGSVAGALTAPATGLAGPASSGTPGSVSDAIRLVYVMDLVVICSAPERMGPDSHSKDGIREFVYPIVGGRFRGPKLAGQVLPGGCDYPVVRPDGVMLLDAQYRLRTDDGTLLIIHNRGMIYPAGGGLPERVRGYTEFTAPAGRHDWLNKSIFTAILVEDDMPAELSLPLAKGQNQRLVRVFRLD